MYKETCSDKLCSKVVPEMQTCCCQECRNLINYCYWVQRESLYLKSLNMCPVARSERILQSSLRILSCRNNITTIRQASKFSHQLRCDNRRKFFLLKSMNMKTKGTIAQSNYTTSYHLLQHHLLQKNLGKNFWACHVIAKARVWYMYESANQLRQNHSKWVNTLSQYCTVENPAKMYLTFKSLGC